MSVTPEEFNQQVHLKTMSVGECFKSYYYQNHYVEPINIEKDLINFVCSNKDIVHRAQSIVSLPEVRKVLSEPFNRETDEIHNKNEILKKMVFGFLGNLYYRLLLILIILSLFSSFQNIQNYLVG